MLIATKEKSQMIPRIVGKAIEGWAEHGLIRVLVFLSLIARGKESLLLGKDTEFPYLWPNRPG